MQLKMTRSFVVMLLSAAALCRHAAATNPPAVKRTKLVTVTGVQLDYTRSPPKFKLPVFQNTTFSLHSGCNHCTDSTLTVKAGAKGVPVITFTAPDPVSLYTTTVTITTSPPTVTVIQTTIKFGGKEMYRFRADIRLLHTEDVWFAWSRRAALDSLNTVTTNAATYITLKESPWPFYYSPDMHLVVAYLKHLAAASKG